MGPVFMDKQDQLLKQLSDQSNTAKAISIAEYQQRIEKLQRLLKDNDCGAIYLHGGTNLYYFCGVRWNPSERLCGALIFADGPIEYIVPHFEIATFAEKVLIAGQIQSWEEHHSPYELVQNRLEKNTNQNAKLAIDGLTPFVDVDALSKANPQRVISNASGFTQACRSIKSDNEIALIQQAMDMTMVIQKMVPQILFAGITTQQVCQFIDRAHRKMGADNGSYFCIVLFGPDSAYPHGVETPKTLAAGDVVLVDTGCQLNGYHSDITRSYVFGEPSVRQQSVWDVELKAQWAAFNAATIGQACEVVDKAARDLITENGFGPDYQLPGLAHRTGHGIGLDIHEAPNLVQGEKALLAQGMCFSNEPMICVPGEFGIRLEDHFYLTKQGPVWFTEPAKSMDEWS